jgi:ribosome-binding factor A
MVTITDVRVTGDLHDATVFYTVFGDDADRAASAAALESAKGVLRTEVGRQTGVRFTPTLTFTLDALPDEARHIDDLLAVAAAADAEVEAARRGARPAGDPDPYRKPRDRGDDDTE